MRMLTPSGCALVQSESQALTTQQLSVLVKSLEAEKDVSGREGAHE